MADNLDAVDIIYDIIKSCGVTVVKDRSSRDQDGEFIVIRSSGNTNLASVNVAQVNVNIFIPRPSNGMVNRPRVETLRTTITNLIKNASDPEGYYCVIDQVFSALLEDVRKDYDCFTIRYELTLNN